jgi:CBS domain-containing protein
MDYPTRVPIADEERRVMSVMVPLREYTTVTADMSVRDAVLRLRESFQPRIAASSVIEPGHRSVLVLDKNGAVQGVISIRDLLEAMIPHHPSAPKAAAESLHNPHLAWKGLFHTKVREIAAKKVTDIMSPAPRTIEGASNLMAAAYMMVMYKERRLVVVHNRQVIGIIREQDLFFEIERLMREKTTDAPPGGEI